MQCKWRDWSLQRINKKAITLNWTSLKCKWIVKHIPNELTNCRNTYLINREHSTNWRRNGNHGNQEDRENRENLPRLKIKHSTGHTTCHESGRPAGGARPPKLKNKPESANERRKQQLMMAEHTDWRPCPRPAFWSKLCGSWSKLQRHKPTLSVWITRAARLSARKAPPQRYCCCLLSQKLLV